MDWRSNAHTHCTGNLEIFPVYLWWVRHGQIVGREAGPPFLGVVMLPQVFIGFWLSEQKLQMQYNSGFTSIRLYYIRKL